MPWLPLPSGSSPVGRYGTPPAATIATRVENDYPRGPQRQARDGPAGLSCRSNRPTRHVAFAGLLRHACLFGIHAVGLAVPRCIAARKMSEPRASPSAAMKSWPHNQNEPPCKARVAVLTCRRRAFVRRRARPTVAPEDGTISAALCPVPVCEDEQACRRNPAPTCVFVVFGRVPGLQRRPDQIYEPAYASVIQRHGYDAVRRPVNRMALTETKPARGELRGSRSCVQLHLTCSLGRESLAAHLDVIATGSTGPSMSSSPGERSRRMVMVYDEADLATITPFGFCRRGGLIPRRQTF